MNQKTLASLKPAIVLTTICMVAALLLSVVNALTSSEIEKQENDKLIAAFEEVLPGATGFEKLNTKDAPKTVKEAYKEKSGMGYALLMTAQSGYHTLEFSLGMDNEGKITGVGTHSQLLESNLEYKEIYESQMEATRQQAEVSQAIENKEVNA